jgi:hypothetical protein
MTVTGFFTALASVHRRAVGRRSTQSHVQGGVERIEWPAGELLGRGPQGAQVLHQFGASLAVTQNVLAPGPVADLESVVTQHLVRYPRPMEAIAAPGTMIVAPGRSPGGTGCTRLVLDMAVRPVEL